MQTHSSPLTRPSVDLKHNLDAVKQENGNKNNIDYENAVVKIFTHQASPNYNQPWTSHNTSEFTGSGFAFKWQKKNVIMTNAHVVLDGQFIQVKSASRDIKYEAKVLVIGFDLDLALLTVEDEKFWENTSFLQLSDQHPKQEMPIKAIGYPIGGNEICFTSGVISRLEMTSSATSQCVFLTAHFDAKGTNGNSGGPILFENKVIGVIHQYGTQQINGSTVPGLTHMVPSFFINHFLEDIIENPDFEIENTDQEKSDFGIELTDQEKSDLEIKTLEPYKKTPYIVRGLTNMEFHCQPMESPYLRKHFQMKDDMSGILLESRDSSATKLIEPYDVLLKIDGCVVSNNRMINYPGVETPVNFRHPLTLHHVGEKVALTILRKGVERNIEIPVTREQTLLSESKFKNNAADYIYCNGLILQAVTNKSYTGPLASVLAEKVTPNKQEVVFIRTKLADTTTQGYPFFENYIITEINGVHPRNLWDVRNAFTYHQGENHFIKVHDGNVMVLPRFTKVKDKNLASRYGITEFSSMRYGLFHRRNVIRRKFLNVVLANEDEPYSHATIERLEAEHQAFVPSTNQEEEEKRRTLEEYSCNDNDRPRIVVMNYIRR